MSKLSDIEEKREFLINRVKSMLFYPTFLAIFSVFLVIYIMTGLVPTIKKIFTEMKAELPLPTKILIGTSDLLTGYWWLWIALLIALMIWFNNYKNTEQGRKKIDALYLKIPYFGNLYRKIILARFFRNAGSLIANNVNIVKSIEIGSSVVTNYVIRSVVDDLLDSLKEGKKISDVLGKYDVIPKMAVGLVAAGEKSDKVGEMFLKVAENLEMDIEFTLQRLTAVIEPIMIIIMGGIIAFIAISILLPIFELNKLIQ